MRLLQIGFRSMLLYSLVMVIISVPISLILIKNILDREVDESLALHTKQFLIHIKTYEHIEDIDLDLKIWDELTYDVALEPVAKLPAKPAYETVTIYDSLAKETNPFRILKSPVSINNKNYILISRISLVDNNELLFALGSSQILMILFLTIGLTWLSNTLSVKLWKPFYQTLEQLKKFKIEKSESIAPAKTNVVEFDDLNDVIYTLTERNRNVYFEQKEFIENASHELQTPLAIIQAKLDNLMQTQDLSEESAQIILELEETTKRIARLNKSLLLISKIDNQQFVKQDSIFLPKVIEKILANLLQITNASGIKIIKSVDDITISANATLIEILILNLIHNAIRHTDANGIIEIKLKNNVFTISNSSTEEELDPTKLFKRFSKISNDENSSGLGLAIVKKICDVNQYDVEYRYENGLHTFEVCFVLAHQVIHAKLI